jgi:hypothetical protein
MCRIGVKSWVPLATAKEIVGAGIAKVTIPPARSLPRRIKRGRPQPRRLIMALETVHSRTV